MKQRIFNKGHGWYISAHNYKDKEDKCYISLFFPKNTEPFYEDNGQGFSVKDINIEEAKFTSYKGKVGLTVFKYLEIYEGSDFDKMGGRKANLGDSVDIRPEELPFY